MSEDIYLKAKEVFEAADKKPYSESFFEHLGNALTENRLERIAKTFKLPETDARKILARAHRIYLDADKEERVERHARAIVNYASRAGTLQRLFDLAEESLTKGTDKIVRIAQRFNIPAHLAHQIFDRAYQMIASYSGNLDVPEKMPEPASQAIGD